MNDDAESIIRHCGDLSDSDLHPHPQYVWMLGPKWNHLERIRGVALLVELGHWGSALRFQKAHTRPGLFSLLADQDVKLSATASAPFMPASHHDDHGLML